MKQNPLLAGLVGVLLICGLCAMWISARYYFSLKELQRVQSQLLLLNSNRANALALAKEAVAYSQRNPAILPLLTPFIRDDKPSTPPAAAPRTPSR